jgi:toxic protein SymE
MQQIKTNYMAKETVRQAKLHGKHRSLENHWRGGKDVPWLNVSGVWLEEAGFEVGSAIEITVQNNQLIIKKCTTKETA